ncbi:hypothetical protein K7432_010432 [Basidiobolus ranarum]|uniref:BZIP domain-containing protein n=1 Tax=Basidiobolus ranarum TaxID=34480 RepID=A0ABR2VWE6_9FUNG
MSTENTSLSRCLPPLSSFAFDNSEELSLPATKARVEYLNTAHNTTLSNVYSSDLRISNILALNNPSPETTSADSSCYQSRLDESVQERFGEDMMGQSNLFTGPSAGRILAEKRKKNATASAKFRDRRKQKEKDILDRCAKLEKKVHQLEFENPFLKQISQLEFDLNQAKLEKFSALEKLNLLEDEVSWLRSLICSKGKVSPEASNSPHLHDNS